MRSRSFWKPRLARASGWLAALALRALGTTWRIRSEGLNPLESQSDPQLGALWHRNILVTAYLFRDSGFSVPVSRSDDGDVIAGALEHLGYSEPPRGSSSRGGAAALRGLVRRVRAGTTVSVQLDGPRGPARRAKRGMVALARLTGTPITPVAISAWPCLRFGSWDGTLLPLPFARVLCAFGEALRVSAAATPEDEEDLTRQLERVLNTLTDELDERLGLVDKRALRVRRP